SDLRAIVDSLATLPSVAAGSAVATGAVSLSLSFAERGKLMVFESIVDTTAGIPMFQKMVQAVAANASATRYPYAAACVSDSTRHSPLADVSDRVAVTLAQLEPEPESDRSMGTLRVTNTSRAPLEAPLHVSIEMPGDVHPLDPRCYTCVTHPSWTPLFDLLPSGELPPGGHTDLHVEFDTAEKDKIEIGRCRVYSGAGNP